MAWIMLGLFFMKSTASGMPGGYSPVSVTNKEVIAATKFAVAAQEKAMLDKEKPAKTTLELVKILSAQQQIVAGVNYRLTLKVTLNGESRQAETLVWWQAWRKPEPYQLMSWKWKNSGK